MDPDEQETYQISDIYIDDENIYSVDSHGTGGPPLSGTLNVWRLSDFQKICERRQYQEGNICGNMYSVYSYGDHVVVGIRGGWVNIYNKQNLNADYTEQHLSDSINAAVDIYADSQYWYFANADGHTYVYGNNITSWNMITDIQTGDTRCNGIYADGQHLYIATDDSILIINLNDWSVETKIAIANGANMTDVVTSGQYLYATSNGRFYRWDKGSWNNNTDRNIANVGESAAFSSPWICANGVYGPNIYSDNSSWDFEVNLNASVDAHYKVDISPDYVACGLGPYVYVYSNRKTPSPTPTPERTCSPTPPMPTPSPSPSPVSPTPLSPTPTPQPMPSPTASAVVTPP